jgi:hypothetical protein
MLARKGLLGGVAGAGALAVAALGTASSADAACASRIYVGEATGVFYTLTGISARSDWRAAVRLHLGGEYAFWSRATRRSTRCYRPAGGGRWTCRAVARPCD